MEVAYQVSVLFKYQKKSPHFGIGKREYRGFYSFSEEEKGLGESTWKEPQMDAQ